MITFKNLGGQEYLASTGETIQFYATWETGFGRGSRGWYVTEVDGEFRGIKHDSFAEAKEYLSKRYEMVAA